MSLLVKAVVEEKELRLKQTMRIMGLRHGVFISSWYVLAIGEFVLIALLCTIVGSIFMVRATSDTPPDHI